PGPPPPASPAQYEPSCGSPHTQPETRPQSGAGSPASSGPPESPPAEDPLAAAPAGDQIEGQGAASSSAQTCIGQSCRASTTGSVRHTTRDTPSGPCE